MLRMLSRIAIAMVVAGALLMTVWAGENSPINMLPRLGVEVAFQEREDVPINRLPSKVTEAIKNRFPKGEMLRAEKDWDGGNVKYEVKVRSEGRIYDVDVTPNGRIIKIDPDNG